MKKIKEYICILSIAIIIILSTLFLGTPVYDDNNIVVYIAIGFLSSLYYIFKREKLINDKIDFWIVILSFSTLIPLIFNTYVSMEGVILSAIKYFCILNLFLITKHECKKNPKNIHIILNTIIISILILCIIGVDELGGNYLKEFKNIIGYKDLGLVESRVGSLFSYANTMAVVAGIGVFLCLGYILSSTKLWVKLIYICIAIFIFITMILTYSRLVYIVFAFICFLYIMVLFKKYNIIKKVNKKLFIGIIIGCLLAIIYIVIGLFVPDKLMVNKKYEKRMYNIEPNTEYNFVFDIDAENIKNNFIIKFIEKDEFMDTVNTTEIKLKNFKGTKEIKLHTKNKTTAIFLVVKNNKNNECVQINSLYINGEEEVLKYKLLPSKLVFKIQGISLSQKSAWQRFVFIKDAFKSIKDNWLFGLGGRAWRGVQLENQEYKYYAKEVHSYPTQIFLENGIVGFIAYIAILLYILRRFFKEIKENDINIVKVTTLISILFIILHSILDFDMSFFYVLIIAFIMLSTLGYEKEKSKSDILNHIILITLVISSMIIVYTSSVKLHFNDNKNMLVVTSKWTEVRIYDTYQKLIPYGVEAKIKKYKAFEKEKNNNEAKKMLKNIIKTEQYNESNLNLFYIFSYIQHSLEIEENVEESLQFALEYVYDTDDIGKYNPDFQIQRIANLKKIVEILYDEKEYFNKFNNQLKKEINERGEWILDYEKCRYPKSKVKKYKQRLNYLLEIDNLNQFMIDN